LSGFSGSFQSSWTRSSELRGLDTEGVEPTAHTLPLRNVERQDLPRLSFPREAMLANAPQVQDGFVRVRKVLE